jgi:hypothetical protein
MSRPQVPRVGVKVGTSAADETAEGIAEAEAILNALEQRGGRASGKELRALTGLTKTQFAKGIRRARETHAEEGASIIYDGRSRQYVLPESWNDIKRYLLSQIRRFAALTHEESIWWRTARAAWGEEVPESAVARIEKVAQDAARLVEMVETAQEEEQRHLHVADPPVPSSAVPSEPA